jgi:hypothetical protein
MRTLEGIGELGSSSITGEIADCDLFFFRQICASTDSTVSLANAFPDVLTLLCCPEHLTSLSVRVRAISRVKLVVECLQEVDMKQ